jgi:hypothetical protein
MVPIFFSVFETKMQLMSVFVVVFVLVVCLMTYVVSVMNLRTDYELSDTPTTPLESRWVDGVYVAVLEDEVAIGECWQKMIVGAKSHVYMCCSRWRIDRVERPPQWVVYIGEGLIQRNRPVDVTIVVDVAFFGSEVQSHVSRTFTLWRTMGVSPDQLNRVHFMAWKHLGLGGMKSNVFIVDDSSMTLGGLYVDKELSIVTLFVDHVTTLVGQSTPIVDGGISVSMVVVPNIRRARPQSLTRTTMKCSIVPLLCYHSHSFNVSRRSIFTDVCRLVENATRSVFIVTTSIGDECMCAAIRRSSANIHVIITTRRPPSMVDRIIGTRSTTEALGITNGRVSVEYHDNVNMPNMCIVDDRYSVVTGGDNTTTVLDTCCNTCVGMIIDSPDIAKTLSQYVLRTFRLN